MNKKKIGVIIVMVIFLIGFMYYKKFDDNPYHQFRSVTNFSAHIQSEDYLYIYKSHDKDCEKLEDQIIDFANNHTMTFMSANEKDGYVVEFDWSAFHTENDIEIGKLDKQKKEIFNEGESVEKYLNSTEVNDLGEINKYEIIIADQEYLKVNNSAKINYIYAKLLTPNVNLETGLRAKYIVLDIPALFYYGEDKSIKEYYFGTDEISAFLKEHN